MKIVVAGGSGFLGRYICRALLDDGHEVTVLNRTPDAVERIPQLRGANATRGDVTDPETLTGAFDGVDGVVGAVQFPNYPMEVPRRGLTFDRYDRQGTENLVAEARRAGVSRFVYISGAGADPSSDKTWYRAKGRAEAAVAAGGIPYAILRPSWAYGPEDKALNKLVVIARFSPVVPRLGMSGQQIQPVFVADIGLTVQRLFQRADAWDSVYEIGSDDIVTMDHVIRTMLDVSGKRRVVIPVPATLAKLATAPLVVLPEPPMTPGGIEFAVQSGLVDPSALHEVLGIHPIPLRDGLARYLAP